MKPIQLDFKPSIIASYLFTLMSCGALSIVMLLSLAWQIKLAASLLIVIFTCYAVCKHGLLLLPWSCVALKINSRNQLQLIRKDGKELQVATQTSSVVTPYLTVLNSQLMNASWQHNLFAQHVIIFTDAVDAEHYRQFRVWLRWAYARKD
ncbi:MAG TPA: protein YgfX [Methylotenera sp.]|nr:protein YgfX [Methylotenera sp.]